MLNKFKFFRSNRIVIWEFNFNLSTIEQFIKQEKYMICFQNKERILNKNERIF